MLRLVLVLLLLLLLLPMVMIMMMMIRHEMTRGDDEPLLQTRGSS
jgi:hypothetical protein